MDDKVMKFSTLSKGDEEIKKSSNLDVKASRHEDQSNKQAKTNVYGRLLQIVAG